MPFAFHCQILVVRVPLPMRNPSDSSKAAILRRIPGIHLLRAGIHSGSAILGLLVITFGATREPSAAASLYRYYP